MAHGSRTAAEVTVPTTDASLFRVVVKNQDIAEMGTHQLDEFLVSGVGQVYGPTRFIAKGDDETVRKPLGLIFHTDVSAPLKAHDRVDF